MIEGGFMKKKRPVLDIPLTATEIWLEIITLAIIIFTLLLLKNNYSLLPAEIPTHFNSVGTPDFWGSKTSLLILTGIMLVTYAGLKIAERFPQYYNYLQPIDESNADYQYLNGRMLMAFIKTETVMIFAYLIWGTVKIARGDLSSLSFWFLPVVLAVMASTTIYFIIKLNKKKDG